MYSSSPVVLTDLTSLNVKEITTAHFSSESTILYYNAQTSNTHHHHHPTLESIFAYNIHCGQQSKIFDQPTWPHQSDNLACIGLQTANHDQQLWTCRQDGQVTVLDVRAQSKQVELQPYNELTGTEFTSFAVSCNAFHACAGTDAVNVRKGKSDYFIVFWDVRQPKLPVGIYKRLHSQTITSLAFHPEEAARLLSGATDGLLCELDLTQSSEDDALQQTWNTESSVLSCDWLLLPSSYDDKELVFSVTGINSCLVWPTGLEEDLDAAASVNQCHLLPPKDASSLMHAETFQSCSVLTCLPIHSQSSSCSSSSSVWLDCIALASTDAEGSKLILSKAAPDATIWREFDLNANFLLRWVFNMHNSSHSQFVCVGNNMLAVCAL